MQSNNAFHILACRWLIEGEKTIKGRARPTSPQHCCENSFVHLRKWRLEASKVQWREWVHQRRNYFFHYCRHCRRLHRRHDLYLHRRVPFCASLRRWRGGRRWGMHYAPLRRPPGCILSQSIPWWVSTRGQKLCTRLVQLTSQWLRSKRFSRQVVKKVLSF